MSDRIRYALGHSAHGDFIAAVAEHDLVAFEFPVMADSAFGRLLARFPDATLEEDVTGLATTVAFLSQAVNDAAASRLPEKRLEDGAPTLGIMASTHRLIRKNGSMAAGRACAASVQAAPHRILTWAERFATLRQS